MTAETKPDRLAGAASAYLRAHAGGPVDWHPWGDEPFAEAAASNRPVLLVIGSSTSHRCHAMRRESFEDAATAAYLNEQFVCVLVDREERPELDALYARAVAGMSGQASPPVTAFLTPDRVPFQGGSYFPPHEREGIQPFAGILRRAADMWRTGRGEILEKAGTIVDRIAGEALDPYPNPPSEEALARAVGRLHAAFDDEYGGLGGEAKPPGPQVLDLLVRAGARGLGKAKWMAERTLGAMALGGMYDHVGGGFHHGTRDRARRRPNFEKLLSDNALLARSYTRAWQAWRAPLYRRIAEETLGYVLADLSTEDGGLAAGRGAESEGVDGRFYTWSYEEFTAAAPGAAATFGVTEAEPANVPALAEEEDAGEALGKLREVRARRVPPERNDMVLASWNGLAIGALAEAGATFGRPDFVEAARAAARCVERTLLDGGALAHCPGVPGLLEDYAHLAEGLLTLWEVTFDRPFLDLAASLADAMVERFWDAEGRGFFATAAGRGDVLVRTKPLLESDAPSGNAVAALVLQRLAALTGDAGHAERAAEVLRLAAPYVEAYPEATAGFFAAVEFHALGPKQVVIVGDPADPAAAALAAEAWARLVPNRVLSGAPPGSGAPLLDGRELEDGRPTAYVHEGPAGLPPTTDPAELARQLRPWKAPTSEQVQKLVKRMEGAVQYRHLLDQLQNPRWMEPLRERGFFAKPPEPILDYTRGTIGSPPWPESGYLARAALGDPATAHAIGTAIPDTENVQVHEDIAELALALPAHLAKDFVPRLAAWAGSPYHLLFADKLGKLLVHLAAGGEVDAALELGRSVLELVPDPMQEAPGEDRFRPSPEPRSKFEEFEFTQLVTERVPELVAAAGAPALGLLCDALEQAITLGARPGEDHPPADHSYIWRPAVEEDLPGDLTTRDVALTTVRDAAVAIAERGPEALAEVLGMLGSRSRHVFLRVALHVLRVVEGAPIDRVRAALLDRRAAEDPHFHHEYLLLAAERFADLDEEDRSRILGWIAEGPQSLDAVARKRWTRDRLALLLDVVPPEWQQRYHELAGEVGPPDHPEFAAPPGAGRRRNSPKSADDLRRMGLEKALDFLATWEPPGGWARPSRDGLAYELMLTVGADPKPYAEAAGRFAELDPAYAEALLFGLREAVKRELPFPWKPVVEMCRRILQRGAEAGPPAPDEPTAGCRREMTHLLSVGFATGPAAIPHDLRESVWEVLGPLTEDPDPGPEREAKLLAAGVQLATISTNTTRGKALHATVQYGLWVRRNIEQGAGSVQRMMAGFDEMPEVREVLDAHLDRARDPSQSLRVVYGWWLPWLVMLDSEWTRRRLQEILPRDRALDDYRHAAWGAYLTFNTPYENLWNLLKVEYRRAAERLDPKAPWAARLPGLEERLAEHLLSVYWRGKMRLEESDSALARFFTRAPDGLAAHAITFAGRALPGWKGPVPGDVKLRLMKLWERRLGICRRDPSEHQLELAAFGWWFATGLFEDKWAIAQLGSVVELTGGRVDSTHMVVAKLAEIAPRAPGSAVEILSRIVEGDRGRTIVGWREQGRAVLAAVLEAPDEQARKAAMDLFDAFDVEPLPQDTTWEAPQSKPGTSRGAAADAAQPA